MNRHALYKFLIIMAVQFYSIVIVHAAATSSYRGVNLSGAEFGGCTKAAVYGSKYIYPSAQLFDFYLAQGANTFRLPFCWERLQPAANSPQDTAELNRLDSAVRYATDRGAHIILDPHNYARYWGKIIEDESGRAAFADLWRQLAARYKNNPRVIFGLMNEPYGLRGEIWLAAANAAIAAIRREQAANLILVPGVAWSGAHSWASTSYGTPNAVVMLNVSDPLNNYAYEMHQYLDSDSSGTHVDCVSADIGSKRLVAATQWLQQNNRRALLGEFGAANNSLCLQALDNLLQWLSLNSQVWIGWTYWSAGAWLGNYMYALPTKETGTPSQLDVLKKYWRGDCAGNACAPPSSPVQLPPQRR